MIPEIGHLFNQVLKYLVPGNILWIYNCSRSGMEIIVFNLME